jgi:hypothetical protein
MQNNEYKDERISYPSYESSLKRSDAAACAHTAQDCRHVLGIREHSGNDDSRGALT